MNPDRQRRSFLIWDGENELPLITVFNKQNRTAFGMFLLTSNPSEAILIPEQDRLVFRTLGDGIFSLYVYAGPTIKDVIKQHY